MVQTLLLLVLVVGITGTGFSTGVIDDPVKSRKEAISPVIRETTKQWFISDFYSRMNPTGKIILIQTRWHRSDLSGFVLEQINKSFT